MSFADLDHAEAALGKPVSMMTDTEMVTYFKLAVFDEHQVNLAVDGYPERAVMAGLKRTYGNRAGQIVKWVAHYASPDDLTFSAFSKKRKWWTDKIDVEVQRHLRDSVDVSRMDEAAKAVFARSLDG